MALQDHVSKTTILMIRTTTRVLLVAFALLVPVGILFPMNIDMLAGDVAQLPL